jgi:hypothetical protein
LRNPGGAVYNLTNNSQSIYATLHTYSADNFKELRNPGGAVYKLTGLVSHERLKAILREQRLMFSPVVSSITLASINNTLALNRARFCQALLALLRYLTLTCFFFLWSLPYLSLPYQVTSTGLNTKNIVGLWSGLPVVLNIQTFTHFPYSTTLPGDVDWPEYEEHRRIVERSTRGNDACGR